MSLANAKFLIGNGNDIWYGVPGNWTLFSYTGTDPSFAWGGAAIIFLTPDRQSIYCANLDGSGLYFVGINAATGCHLAKPHLALNNSLYMSSSWNPTTGERDICTFGASGYNLTTVALWAPGYGKLNGAGTHFACSGFNQNTGHYRVFFQPTAGGYQYPANPYNTGFCPNPLEGSGFVDMYEPSFEHDAGSMSPNGVNLACTISTNAAAINEFDPSTYNNAQVDIAVFAECFLDGFGNPQSNPQGWRLGANAPGGVVGTPSLCWDDTCVSYLFNNPGQTDGTWAYQWGGTSMGVFGNPSDPSLTVFGNAGATSIYAYGEGTPYVFPND